MKRELAIEVWKLDDSKCRACGDLVPCDLSRPPHHIKYRSQGGEDVVENLITLCMLDDYGVHNGAKVDGVWKPGRWIMLHILNKLKDDPGYRWDDARKELELCGEVMRAQEVKHGKV